MFFNKLDMLCKQNGTTVTAFTKNILKMSSGNVTKWKNGAEPSLDVFREIADYFNVTTDYLLGKTDDPTPPNSDVTFDDFTYAFYEESKDLTKEDKENLLEMARIFKKRRQERDKK